MEPWCYVLCKNYDINVVTKWLLKWASNYSSQPHTLLSRFCRSETSIRPSIIIIIRYKEVKVLQSASEHLGSVRPHSDEWYREGKHAHHSSCDMSARSRGHWHNSGTAVAPHTTTNTSLTHSRPHKPNSLNQSPQGHQVELWHRIFDFKSCLVYTVYFQPFLFSTGKENGTDRFCLRPQHFCGFS